MRAFLAKMNADHWIRGHLTWVVLGGLGLAAYLQARGVCALLGTGLLPTAAQIAAGVPRSGPLHSQPRPTRRLVRNIFDSTRGPWLEAPSAPAAQPTFSDPLSAPECDGVQVLITTQSPDPTWSLALVRGPQDKRGVERRVGDHVGPLEVRYIGADPTRHRPAVWFAGDQGYCRSFVFADRKAAQSAPPPAPQPAASRTSVRRRSMPLPPALAQGIRQVSETEYLVERSTVDRIMRDFVPFTRGTRARPVQQNGQVTGLKLSGISPQTLLGRVGIKNGDQIRAVNRFPITSPVGALQTYGRLRTANQLHLDLVREGKPVEVDIRIR